MVMKVTFEDEHGEKTGNVEIREGTCEDYEDSDDELDFYDDDDEEWF